MKQQIKNLLIALQFIIIAFMLFSKTSSPIFIDSGVDSLKTEIVFLQTKVKTSEEKIDSLKLLNVISQNDQDNKIALLQKQTKKQKIDVLIERYAVLDTTTLAQISTDLMTCEVELDGCTNRTEVYQNIISEKDTIIEAQKSIIKTDALIEYNLNNSLNSCKEENKKLTKKLKMSKIVNKVFLATTAILALLVK